MRTDTGQFSLSVTWHNLSNSYSAENWNQQKLPGGTTSPASLSWTSYVTEHKQRLESYWIKQVFSSILKRLLMDDYRVPCLVTQKLACMLFFTSKCSLASVFLADAIRPPTECDVIGLNVKSSGQHTQPNTARLVRVDHSRLSELRMSQTATPKAKCTCQSNGWTVPKKTLH